MSHNGHSLHNASKLQNWIEHELIHLAEQNEEELVETEIPDRSLSLRIPITTHLMLYRIAQKLGRSKTACSEEVLTIAVRDVYGQLELPRITPGDIDEYAQQTEKAIPEKAIPEKAIPEKAGAGRGSAKKA